MAQTLFKQSSKLVLGGIIVVAAIAIAFLPRKKGSKRHLKSELISSSTEKELELTPKDNDLEPIQVFNVNESTENVTADIPTDIPTNATENINSLETTVNDVEIVTNSVESTKITESSPVIIESTVESKENTKESEVCALYKSRSIDSIVSFIKNVVETNLETEDESDVDEPISKAFNGVAVAVEAAVVDFMEKVENAVEDVEQIIEATNADEDSEQTRFSIDSVDYSAPVGTVGFEWGMAVGPNTEKIVPGPLKEQAKSTPEAEIKEEALIEKENLSSDEIDGIPAAKRCTTLPDIPPTNPPALDQKPSSPPKTGIPMDLSSKTTELNVDAPEFVPIAIYNSKKQGYESANPYQGYQTTYHAHQYQEYHGQSHSKLYGHNKGTEQRRQPTRKRKEKAVEKVPTVFDFVKAKTKESVIVGNVRKEKCMFGKGCVIKTCKHEH